MNFRNNVERNREVKLNMETFGERGRNHGRRQSINNIPGQGFRFRGGESCYL